MTTPTDPLSELLARIQAAQPAEHDRRLTTLESQHVTSTLALGALAQKIHNLEAYMALSDEKIAAITANLQNIQGDVARLNELTPQLQGQIDALRGELDAVDPALAAKLQPLEDLSRQIADATPEPVVVPDPEPTPEPEPVDPGEGGGEPVEPAPVEPTDPPVEPVDPGSGEPVV